MSSGRESESSLLRVEDDSVIRRAGPWAPAVHELLGYLEQEGFPYSPWVLEAPEAGLERLTYRRGESGPDAWAKVVPEEGLIAFARLLRAYHQAVANFHPHAREWATVRGGVSYPRPVPSRDQDKQLLERVLVCHGDFGPWNTVWEGERPVGIIDFDMAGPRAAVYDIAYALEYVAPFRDDQHCLRWLRYPAPPNRAARLETFARAYGLSSGKGLYEQVLAVQASGLQEVALLASRGVQPQQQWVEEGHLRVLAERIEWSARNRALFLSEGEDA